MIADGPPSAKRKRPRRQNIARFVIRVAGERRWQWEPSYQAMILIEKALKQLLAEKKLELDLSHIRTPKQAIMAIDLFEVELDVLRIPTKPATDSERKSATCSNLKPAAFPI